MPFNQNASFADQSNSAELFFECGDISIRHLEPQHLNATFLAHVNLIVDDSSFYPNANYNNSGLIVSGRAKVNGCFVYIYSQSHFDVGYPLSKLLSAEMEFLIRKSVQLRGPLIEIKYCDNMSFRKQSPFSFADVHREKVLASGRIPLICLQFGYENLADTSAPSDFVFCVQDAASSNIIGQNLMTIHRTFYNEIDAIRSIKELIDYLMIRVKYAAPLLANIAKDIRISALNGFISSKKSAPYDTNELITTLVDNNVFYEIQPNFANNIITCFARLAGQTVGIVANNAQVWNGALDKSSSYKTTKFVRFCDALKIPLITLVDAPRFFEDSERCNSYGDRLFGAYALATNFKSTVVTRKCSTETMNVMTLGFFCGTVNYFWTVDENVKNAQTFEGYNCQAITPCETRSKIQAEWRIFKENQTRNP